MYVQQDFNFLITEPSNAYQKVKIKNLKTELCKDYFTRMKTKT